MNRSGAPAVAASVLARVFWPRVLGLATAALFVGIALSVRIDAAQHAEREWQPSPIAARAEGSGSFPQLSLSALDVTGQPPELELSGALTTSGQVVQLVIDAEQSADGVRITDGSSTLASVEYRLESRTMVVRVLDDQGRTQSVQRRTVSPDQHRLVITFIREGQSFQVWLHGGRLAERENADRLEVEIDVPLVALSTGRTGS